MAIRCPEGTRRYAVVARFGNPAGSQRTAIAAPGERARLPSAAGTVGHLPPSRNRSWHRRLRRRRSGPLSGPLASRAAERYPGEVHVHAARFSGRAAWPRRSRWPRVRRSRSAPDRSSSSAGSCSATAPIQAPAPERCAGWRGRSRSGPRSRSRPSPRSSRRPATRCTRPRSSTWPASARSSLPSAAGIEALRRFLTFGGFPPDRLGRGLDRWRVRRLGAQAGLGDLSAGRRRQAARGGAERSRHLQVVLPARPAGRPAGDRAGDGGRGPRRPDRRGLRRQRSRRRVGARRLRQTTTSRASPAASASASSRAAWASTS